MEPRTLDLLCDLAANPERLIRRDELIERVYMGDLLAKAQDKVAALAAYQVAKAAPDWETWDFQELLEARIRTLDERVAAARTEQSLDDLEAAWNASDQCLLCHRD